MDHPIIVVSPWLMLPFAALLAAIATMPFIAGDWWHKHYKWVAIVLGAGVAGWYFAGLQAQHRVWETLHEYVGFFAIMLALYTVSGGIHITIKGRSTPNENLAFLIAGAVIANLVGTTGASMLLIRPYLRNNRYRVSAYHVVFFILIVSNVGGALTPIGDPPLFLGYLRGIPFFWITEHSVLPWLTAVVLLLGIFYWIDRRNFRRMPERLQHQVIAEGEKTIITGGHNVVWLAVVIGAVFIQNPPFLREGVMLAAAAACYFTTKREIYLSNKFTFGPVLEVGYLFIGIFLTMMPALDWLAANARTIGADSPQTLYWATGILSAVLDNAPTYLTFLAASMGAAGMQIGNRADVLSFLGTHEAQVVAISVAAVFFGAMTYIGNGPNFMVKSIAQHSGVQMTGFFGYIGKFTLPILVPILLIVWILFFL